MNLISWDPNDNQITALHPTDLFAPSALRQNNTKDESYMPNDREHLNWLTYSAALDLCGVAATNHQSFQGDD